MNPSFLSDPETSSPGRPHLLLSRAASSVPAPQRNGDDLCRLLVLSSHFSPRTGGVETSNTQYLDVAEKLDGLRLTILTYGAKSAADADTRWRRGTVLRVSVPKVLLDFMLGTSTTSRIDLAAAWKKGIYLFLHMLFLTAGVFRRYRVARNCQVLVSNGALVEALPTVLLARVFGKPFVLRWRTDISWFLAKPVGRMLMRWVLSRSAAIVVNGSDIRQEIIDRLSLAPERVHVGRNPVDTHCYHILDMGAARAARGLPAASFLLLFAGVLDGPAQCDFAVSLAGLLLAQTAAFHFVFVGDGPMKSDVAKLHARFPAGITLVPHAVPPEELVLYINAAHLVIAKADVSYLSRLAMESLACGTPALVPNCPVSSFTAGVQRSVQLANTHPFVCLIPPQPENAARFLIDRASEFSAWKVNDAQRLTARQFVLDEFDMIPVIRQELALFASAE